MTRCIFNPEHDLCLADGREDYIPPASAVEFGEQCRWIERFMGVSCQEGGIIPWGWNRVLRKRLQQEGVPAHLLPDDSVLDMLRRNSRREAAVELLERLYGREACDSSQPRVCRMLTPDYRVVARSLGEIEAFLEERGRVVLKAPLSGSGKGIRFVTGKLTESDRGWCRRVLERQGAVVVEERLEVVQELAMLFEYGAQQAAADADSAVAGDCGARDVEVRFMGYSLFYASNGAYRGNLLASNEYMENFLLQWIPGEMLERVRCGVERFLKGKLQGRGQQEDDPQGSAPQESAPQERVQQGMELKESDPQGKDGLRGFVGVDQFICRRQEGEQLFYNPAVEINLRMTMGHIARNIYDLHSAEFGLGEGTHCFEPLRGIFPCGEEAVAADQIGSV